MPERPSRDPRPREDRAAQEALVDELVGRIRSRGSIPFAEYMEAALYHPVGGYYTSGRSAGGVDFRTSPQMHRAFGELLAAQVLEMRRRIEDASRFRIVELGPGDGTLAQAFLDAWGREAGDGWEYHLVETSPALRKAQRQRLASLPAEILRHTAWSDADALAGAPCDGVVLSNEFFDALPVHAVRRSEGRLLEVRVGWEPDAGFVEVLAPAEGDELASYLERYGHPLAEGQCAELGLAALGWVDRIASMLERGWVVTIDYGDPADRLYGPRRPGGTRMAYREHRAGGDLLSRTGEQDLTAHVNFTALERRGAERGLRAAPLRTQTEFLLALGALDRMRRIGAGAGSAAERWQEHFAWKEVFVPGGMGEGFRVLIQAKGAPLDGLRGLQSPWDAKVPVARP